VTAPVTRVRLGSAPGRGSAALLAVPVTETFEAPGATDPGLQKTLEVLRGTPDFAGRPGDSALLVAAVGGSPGPRPVLALGVGSADPSVDDLRLAAATLGRSAAGYRRVETTLAHLAADPAAGVRAVAEGFLAGIHRHRSPLSGPPAETAPDLTLLLPAATTRRTDVRRALETALISADAVSWARRLVDAPAGEVTPQVLAELVRERARSCGVRARVWTAATLRARGFGATLGVGSGSAHAPVVVELTTGSGRPRLGLTGKGITFDAGGLNLKRDPAEIRWMKSDMAAAAAVAAAVCAAAELGSRTSVRALLPLAENVIGERSLRPGDVVVHPDGRRTEVLDTDSEGRLVLADAIAYLARSGVDEVVDVGTLTDGGGLGPLMWGCFGNDPALVSALVVSGDAAGDRGWALPLRREYRRLLGSDVADVVNVAWDAPDGAQLAATYLSTFADGVRWAHIDNGSTAYLESAFEPWPKGATGSPTRALLEFLTTRREGRSPA
jgi:leucyl aminopeptidase